MIDDGRDFGEALARVTWPVQCDFRDSGEALARVTWPGLPLLSIPTQLAQLTHFQRSYQDPLDQIAARVCPLVPARRPADPPAPEASRVEALPAKTPTVAEPVQELLMEVTRLQAIIAQREAELAAEKAAKQARRSEAQARADAATQKARAAREKFAQIVDDRLANSEADVTFDDAIVYAIKKTQQKSLRSWLSLPEDDQERAKRAAKERYRRARRAR